MSDDPISPAQLDLALWFSWCQVVGTGVAVEQLEEATWFEVVS